MKNLVHSYVKSVFIFAQLAFLVFSYAPHHVEAKAAKAAAKTEEAKAGDAASGQKLYSGLCFTCHGQKGEGVPNLGAKIAGAKSDEIIAKMKDIKNGEFKLTDKSKAILMQGMIQSYTDQQIADVAAYVSQLK